MAGDNLGLNGEIIKDLSVIDKSELKAMAEKIVKNLLFSATGYGGELYKCFSKTLEMIAPKTAQEIAEEFLESKEYQAYHLIPFQGKGLSLQEAFFNFFSSHIQYKDNTLLQEYLKHEFLCSTIRLLAINPNPIFRFESKLLSFGNNMIIGIESYSKQFIMSLAIKNSGAFFLYAFNGQQIIVGPIPELYADILLTNHSMEEFQRLYERRRVSKKIVKNAYKKLSDLHLLNHKAA